MNAAQRSRTAAWMKDATEITPRKAKGGHVLDITELCSAAGLKVSSVRSTLNRTRRLKPTVPMSHLALPDFRIGSTPYWSREQLDRYITAKALESQRLKDLLAGLEVVTPAEADERGLVGMREIGRRVGIGHAALYRAAEEEGFPDPVAVIPSRGPQPHVLRKWSKVAEWFRASRPGWEPAAVQDDTPR